jgi:hypothetical protein
MRTENYQKPIISVELVLCDNCFSTFSPLLQRGVMVPLNSEVILRHFLYDRLGLSPEFVEDYLSTIFLNGKPVDDLDQATLRGDDTLALSAAMPGLVGATMRRQGLVASLRSGISHRPEERPESGSSSNAITLKLFNLMIEAVGPTILENGVLLPQEDWEQFLQSAGLNLWDRCRTVRINGQDVTPQEEPFNWGTKLGLINVIVSCGSIS